MYLTENSDILKSVHSGRGDRHEFRSQKDPLAAFCRCAQGEGYGLTIGDIVSDGEEYSCNQLKSTNGGGVTPYAYFDDPYEMFFVELEYYQKNQPPEKKE